MRQTNYPLILITCIYLTASLPIAKIPGAAAISASSLTTTKLLAQQRKEVQPLPKKDCSLLQSKMAKTLKLRVLSTTVPFKDLVTQTKGKACQLSTTSNGHKFRSINNITNLINKTLTLQGWKVNQKYAADAPEGKVEVFSHGNSLAILQVDSALAHSVKCSNNVPIATCYQRAKPEQVIYNIKLQAVSQ